MGEAQLREREQSFALVVCAQAIVDGGERAFRIIREALGKVELVEQLDGEVARMPGGQNVGGELTVNRRFVDVLDPDRRPTGDAQAERREQEGMASELHG